MFAFSGTSALLYLTLPLVASGVSLWGLNQPIPGSKYLLNWAENISVPLHPGYTELPKEIPGHMVVTSFEATPFFGKNAVYLYNFASQSAGLQQLPGSEQLNWPNAVTGLDASIFGFPAMSIGSGFLVPSHTTGGVWILEASVEPKHIKTPVKITKDKFDLKPDSGWFYHLAVPIDMNGDGRMDFLTARCQYGVWPWSNKQGELLWLEHPASDALSGQPWTEHHLADGPDFLFAVQPGTSELALAAPEFVGQQLVYYFMEHGMLKNRILDSKSGPGFSCSWVDLNGDGRLDLLATNHLNQNGSVFAYEFDSDDFRTAAVKRHQLAGGFNAATTSKGTASPGDAVAFQPKITEIGKPHVFLSGDNSNSIFILVPASQDPSQWQYKTTQLAYLGADIGRPSIGDTDGDGFADVYIPAFDNNALVHYKFTSAEAPIPVLV